MVSELDKTMNTGTAAFSPEKPVGHNQDAYSRAVWIIPLWILLTAGLFFVDSLTVREASTIGVSGSWLRSLLTASIPVLTVWGFFILGGLVLVCTRRFWPLLAYVSTVTVTVGLLHLLKIVVGRARPSEDLGAFHFELFAGSAVEYDSFPSGHTTAAFLLAFLVSLYYPKFRPVIIVIALAGAVSRVIVGRHFPSDVVAGIGLAWFGVAMGRFYFGPHLFPRLLLAGTASDAKHGAHPKVS